MLRIEYAYWLCGLLLAICAIIDARARRPMHTAFWGILAVVFLGGDAFDAMYTAGDKLAPSKCVGVGRDRTRAAGGIGKTQTPRVRRRIPRRASRAPTRFGNTLFLPALLIPLGTLAAGRRRNRGCTSATCAMFDSRQATLTALGLACVLALLAAMWLTRAGTGDAGMETARLLDALSWAALLPMLLATLGGVFTATGVGATVGHLSSMAIPADSRLACVIAYAFGMVAFTVIMGNAFAAFPVMTAGIGLPLLIQQHHANPAALGALGMLTGYCGTLLTPMAANFNIVPVALLELRDPNAVIKQQWQTAFWLFIVNIILMYFFAFPMKPTYSPVRIRAVRRRRHQSIATHRRGARRRAHRQPRRRRSYVADRIRACA